MTKAKGKGGKPGRRAAPPDAKRPGRTAPGPLTPTGGNHREATETAHRIERRRQAWQLYVYNRWSMREIAEYLSRNGLPCTTDTVSKDIYAMAAESKQETAATMRHGIDMELRRLDQLDRLLLPAAHGDISNVVLQGRGRKRKAVQVPIRAEPRVRLQQDAIDSLRRNSESRRKLLGTDRQPDAGFIAIGQVMGAVRGLIGDVLALTESNVALRKQLADSMRKHFGAIDGEVAE